MTQSPGSSQNSNRIPLMMTYELRFKLKAKGFSEEEISQMTPAEGWEKLGGVPDEIAFETNAGNNGHQPTPAVALPPRYIVHDASEALLPLPPRVWVMEEQILERSINLWIGRYGSKKTWSMLSAAVCIALQKPWLGFNVPNPAKVLYIDQDMGEDYTREYLAKCIRGELGESTIAGNLSFISGAGFDLYKPDDVQAICEEIIRADAKVVFMDALRNFTPGRDENSVKEMQPALNTLRYLAYVTRAAFVVSHHENRAGEFSGSTAIPGGVDCMLSIKSEEGKPFIFFKTGKKRSGKPQEFAGQATWSDDGQQFYLTFADLDALKPVDPKTLDVFNYFESEGDKSMPELQAFFDRIGKTTLYKIIDFWVKKGSLERKNPGAPKGQPAIYGTVSPFKQAML